MTSRNAVLYIVATPIGNLADITQRAISILKTVDVIAAEDTRHTGLLLKHLNIKNKMLSLHEHNERSQSSIIIKHLEHGESVALVSDAGTPLISDPGFFLVREARQAGFKVVPVPGACAMITALSVSGIATDRFVFEGFLPHKQGVRQKQLKAIANESRTLVFYESTHRIIDCLKDMKNILGDERLVTIARELTKTFETVHSDTLKNTLNWMQDDMQQKKGEFVVILSGNQNPSSTSEVEVDRMVDILMKQLPMAQATAAVAEISGQRKKELYQRALLRKNT
ncbi:MAG: 16S rRNA (cytidine(1402)-2'-O)-methyltransferase [Gammaproteobacteria bacterium]|nr:16S rRNA (cytidine(1402)-2'-O)-methyltransferase [Gammaproteobacteria bacterium]